MIYNVYLVGVGGQGVLTIGELIAETALLDKIPVNYYPTEGMAQRGGLVKAQIRIGQEFVGPHIPEKNADLIVAMEVSEALRTTQFIKPGSDFLLWGHIWLPTASLLGKQGYPGLDTVKEKIAQAGAKLLYLDPANLPTYQGSAIPDNLYVLGAAVRNTSLGKILNVETMGKAIENRWPKAAEKNLYAFQCGFEMASD
ncbi:MAG: hypothetical protein HPY59_13025 [Anaerolineae bacterium]|nr:hypothetical protein [Anaerolineae bacterium]